MTTETKNADTLTSSATDLAKYNYLIFVILSTEPFTIVNSDEPFYVWQYGATAIYPHKY